MVLPEDAQARPAAAARQAQAITSTTRERYVEFIAASTLTANCGANV
jgi:hypothetical protein